MTVIPYNYPDFLREVDDVISTAYKKSPRLGKKSPDFPLWHLNGGQTSFSEIWRQHAFTIVEFGSFT